MAQTVFIQRKEKTQGKISVFYQIQIISANITVLLVKIPVIFNFRTKLANKIVRNIRIIISITSQNYYDNHINEYISRTHQYQFI